MDQNNSNYTLIGDPPGDNNYNPAPPHPHVPPGWNIQSGGGSANMYSGYYQGPYSSRATRSDIYGNSLPYTNIGGHEDVITDMYNGVNIAKMQPRTSSDYASMIEKPYGNTETGSIDYPYGQQVLYKEGFTQNYDILDDPKDFKDTSKPKNKNGHPILVFFIIALIFLAIDLWIQFGNSFIKNKIFSGKSVSTLQFFGMSMFVTLVLLATVYFSKLSLTWFEKRV